MVSIVKCTQCQKEVVPLGQSTVSLVFSQVTFCDYCKHMHNDKQELYFCCLDCLYHYLDNNFQELDKI